MPTTAKPTEPMPATTLGVLAMEIGLPLGAIIGIAVGGGVLLILVVVLIVCLVSVC